MTSDLSCGMSSSHFFWHFKMLNPSKLSDYITLSFQGNQFCLMVEYEFTSECSTLKRRSDLLFVIIPSYYTLYPPPRK